jgi:hypothetical protein
VKRVLLKYSAWTAAHYAPACVSSISAKRELNRFTGIVKVQILAP